MKQAALARIFIAPAGQYYIYDSIEDSPLDNDVIFSKIAELALKLVDGEICSILLYDEHDKEFHAHLL